MLSNLALMAPQIRADEIGTDGATDKRTDSILQLPNQVAAMNATGLTGAI